MLLRHIGGLPASAAMLSPWLVLSLLTTSQSASAEPRNPHTDWFRDAGYGVFVHYLALLQNNPDHVASLGRETSWDDCVREFDTERFADAMSEAGAGYVVFTVMQLTRFMCAPNATFDRISGYEPGEACSTRDLIADLYDSLSARGIPLMLYWTGQGPCADPQAGPAFGCGSPVSDDFVDKWASVLQEYSERYGDRVVGWWIDACYPFIGYDDAKLAKFSAAAKAGNPASIVALNRGVDPKVMPYTVHEDYTAGEQSEFLDRPAGRWIEGEQWHILSYLGSWWGDPGVRYGKAELAAYIYDVNADEGVVSVDVLLFRDGGLDRSQLEVLRELRPRMAAIGRRDPIPPGNLAYRKPARLLSLDGARELQPNGDMSGMRFARNGVDGDPATVCQPMGEWPWTYQVDLLKPFPVRRIRVSFGRAYATRVRVMVSEDGSEWTTITEADGLQGEPYECEVEPILAQYVRICGLKPDGPDQPGGQMSITELEVYE